MPTHSMVCQHTALQVRPPMAPTYKFVQVCLLTLWFANIQRPTSSSTHGSYLQVCSSMPTHSMVCQHTALQVRPPMAPTYKFVQVCLLTLWFANIQRPTSSSTHGSYLQVCSSMPTHSMVCQHTALQVRPPMAPTYKFVQVCLLTLWFANIQRPTSSSTHGSYLQVCSSMPTHSMVCQHTAPYKFVHPWLLLTSLFKYAYSLYGLPTYSALQVRPPMAPTYKFVQVCLLTLWFANIQPYKFVHPWLLLTSLFKYAYSLYGLPTYSALQVRPPMAPTYKFVQVCLLTLWFANIQRPTSSSTHGSYLQVCSSMPTHSMVCQHTALQVRPPMAPTYKFVQVCLLTLWFANIQRPTSSSTHGSYLQVCSSMPTHSMVCQHTAPYKSSLISKHFSFFIWYIFTFSLLTWHPLNLLFPPRCHKPAMLRSKELLPTPLGPHSINDSPERRFSLAQNVIFHIQNGLMGWLMFGFLEFFQTNTQI